MSKTKGSKNYFQGDKLYILKDVIPYIKKNEPSLEVPQSWDKGCGLNDLAKKFGINPDYDNGIVGRGHFTKYKATTLYKFAALVVDYLKSITPKKPRLTPIEVANKEAQKQEVESLVCRAPTPEELERLKRAMDNTPLEFKPYEEPRIFVSEEVPKGFVIFTKTRYHDSVLVRVDDILQVEEFFGEDTKVITKVFPDIRVEQTFEEIVDLIRKALEV